MKYSSEKLNEMMNTTGTYNDEMARLTKINRDKIIDFRRGKKIPTVLEAMHMAQVLKCKMTDFSVSGKL